MLLNLIQCYEKFDTYVKCIYILLEHHILVGCDYDLYIIYIGT